jgi:hypothetical protein
MQRWVLRYLAYAVFNYVLIDYKAQGVAEMQSGLCAPAMDDEGRQTADCRGGSWAKLGAWWPGGCFGCWLLFVVKCCLY